MAVVGYWETLAEAEKLVQSPLYAGVVQELWKEGDLNQFLPLVGINSPSVLYNRQDTYPTGTFLTYHEKITPTNNQTYGTQQEAVIKQLVMPKLEDKFMRDTFRNPNDMTAQMLKEMAQGMKWTMEDAHIYGNTTTNSKEYNGLHALIDSSMVINQGSGSTGDALSFMNVRKLFDSVKPKPDLFICTHEVARRLDAAGHLGITTGGTNTVYPGGISLGSLNPTNMGGRISSLLGVPLLRSDFLTQTETISGGDYSAKTGGATSSIFAIKFGHFMEGGLCMVAIADTIGPDFNKMEIIDPHPDYNAVEYRLLSYLCLALGSTKALGCIDGITDAEVVA
ncbi:MAG: hypothetical protein SVY53_05295 [Chloroflexota bacterium]|nr:hypothetical protein [Chloroflexota bacterium]